MDSNYSKLLVDDYATSDKPVIKNILILSLSLFPSIFNSCKYTYKNERPVEYFYQQEPFPMHLMDKLSDCGEIIMLATPKTLESSSVTKNSDPPEAINESPHNYFIKTVKNMSSPDTNILFKSVLVKENNPIDAIYNVIDHLRRIKENNAKEEFNVYIGTNGGFRSIQLVLEAILSLLKVEGIIVNPDNVFSTIGADTKYELVPSAAEFKIFDFVSGMNEFFNYGRIGSLLKFKESNSNLFSDTDDLFECLKEISEGIQFCSIKNFKSGLNHLKNLNLEDASKNNMYIKMFRENIKRNFTTKYGADLLNEHLVLDEIKWCIEKGFYQQAFTLCEGSLPKEFLKKNIWTYDNIALATAKDTMRDGEDKDIYIFNNYVMANIKKDKKTKKVEIKNILDKRRNRNSPIMKFQTPNAGAFKPVLAHHRYVKDDRNLLNHNDENGNKAIDDYRKTLDNYVNEVKKFYTNWDKLKNPHPVLEVCGIK